MTTDQERTTDALCLFHGGWLQITPLAKGKVLATTAGDQPDYAVWPNGNALRLSTPEQPCIRLSAEQVQLAVYQEGASA